MSLDKFALERALAYEHLTKWINKFKDNYAENPEFADLMLSRELVIVKDGDARFISPKESQAALVLYNIVTIEACIETGEANEVFEGETNLTHLLKSLKAHIAVLTELNNNEFTALDYTSTKPVTATSDKALTKREMQYEIILKEIEALGYDKMLIPDGGKSKIKKACLSNHKIFLSENSFTGAWKDGRRLDLFKMANIAKYS
jgi:hypothetical protein